MVISEELRTALYPLGLISTFAFTLRFVIQWVQSEKAGRSTVSLSFWWISLVGNLSLLVHALIQGQYFVCLVQGINAVISLRNINLMHQNPWPLSRVLFLLGFMLCAITGVFFTQDSWFRVPLHQFQTTAISLPLSWNLIGFLGIVLFASRFWVQWIQAEYTHKSTLELPFWWLSLIGALLSSLYFALIHDYINLVGPLFGLIPYFRNLLLMRKAHA